VYSDPEHFDPERWLHEVSTPAMREHFMPFSKGGRACLGRNLALIELRLLTLALLRRFDVKAATGTSSDGMEMRDLRPFPDGFESWQVRFGVREVGQVR
jgi:cytochrome P450